MTNVPTGPTGEAMPIELTAADMRGILRRFHEAQHAHEADDPMLAFIRLYEAERQRYNAADDPDEDADGALLFWMVDHLMHNPPPIRTEAGAAAALRLVADSLDNEFGGFQEALVAAALRFLRQAGA